MHARLVGSQNKRLYFLSSKHRRDHNRPKKASAMTTPPATSMSRGAALGDIDWQREPSTGAQKITGNIYTATCESGVPKKLGGGENGRLELPPTPSVN